MKSNLLYMFVLITVSTQTVFVAKASAEAWVGASGYTPGAVCASQPFDDDKTKCAEIISGGSFQTGALWFCRWFNFWDNKNKCMELIKNKTYSYDQLVACNSEAFDDEKIACIQKYTGDSPNYGSSNYFSVSAWAWNQNSAYDNLKAQAATHCAMYDQYVIPKGDRWRREDCSQNWSNDNNAYFWTCYVDIYCKNAQ